MIAIAVLMVMGLLDYGIIAGSRILEEMQEEMRYESRIDGNERGSAGADGD